MRKRNLLLKTAAMLTAAACLISLMTACGNGTSAGTGSAGGDADGTASAGSNADGTASAGSNADGTVSAGSNADGTVSADSDSDIAASGSTAGSISSKETDSGTDTGTVVIYSPHDADPLNADIVAFMNAYPSIKVVLVAGGTVELCDKIRGQGDSPEADVLWGGGADTLSAYSDCFEPYTSSNSTAIDPGFIASDKKWTGESPLPMVIIYNKKLLAEAGITEPSSWEDLLDPALKGKIAYCQPSKSGSAYTQLCTMILAMGGKTAGWDYVRKLAKNLDGRILDSSGKCHKLVASGEFTVGITIEKSAALYMDNQDVGYCYPSEGTSAVPDAIAIVKNCPHEENAKLFEDFILSHDAQEEQSKNWNRRPSRNDVSLPEGLSPIKSIRLVDYDFSWAAAEKENIIKEFNAVLAG